YFDCFADENIFGKKIGGDILDAKKTFLYITAYQSIEDEKDKQDFYNLYNDKNINSNDKINKVIDIYKKLNIDKKTEEQINYHIMKAQNNIDLLSLDKEKKSLLTNVINVIANRSK
ncbi:MAG TPA: polyprenyl synthetase family protein, partial [Bacteroidales bacterium]|nr:polyprenyl synthetase family protein [Bacteroidales bacterium]